jgi:hypothetical protein
MLTTFLRKRLRSFYLNNIAPDIKALQLEQIYQGIFHQQLRSLRIEENFFPVGAAASYSLMYFLARVLSELPVRRIVELGSGQSSVLIDRIRQADGWHRAFEQSAIWAARVKGVAPRCDVRTCQVVPKVRDGVPYDGFDGLEVADFDLLVVDGPVGTDRYSRFDCVELVLRNQASDFIVVIDDAGRPGEQETVQELLQALQQRGVDFKLNYLVGRTTQAVLTTPLFRSASYYF